MSKVTASQICLTRRVAEEAARSLVYEAMEWQDSRSDIESVMISMTAKLIEKNYKMEQFILSLHLNAAEDNIARDEILGRRG